MKNVLPERILVGARRDYTISHLVEGLKVTPTIPQERVVMNRVLPPWQRPFVWDLVRQVAFIEGVFLGLGTGMYVVNGCDYNDQGELFMSGWVIDGQQRLTSIDRFMKDEFPVFRTPDASDGIYYSQLSVSEKRRRFLSAPFPAFELEYQAEEDKLKELYRRLNFGGVNHTLKDLSLLEG